MKKPKYKRGEEYDIHKQTQAEMKSWEREKAENNKKRQKVLKIAAVGVGRERCVR
jgi:hypothetical protein